MSAVTLDYNFQASIWATYSSNRILLADSFYQPLLDYVPMARRAAAEKNCSGLSFIGHIGPWGTAGTLAVGGAFQTLASTVIAACALVFSTYSIESLLSIGMILK